MRKEYSHARSLAVSQAQLLRAHDEIRMATSRLHLREDENDNSVDALGPNELESANVLHSNEKFISLTMLSRIKGRLRYLKVSTHPHKILNVFSNGLGRIFQFLCSTTAVLSGHCMNFVLHQ